MHSYSFNEFSHAYSTVTGIPHRTLAGASILVGLGIYTSELFLRVLLRYSMRIYVDILVKYVSKFGWQ